MTLRRATTERTGRAAAAAVLLPGLLLVAGCADGHGATARPAAAPDGRTATDQGTPTPRDPLPGGLGDPATAPTGAPVFEPDGPRTPSYGGLGTLTSCDSGRRLAVLNAPPSDVPDGAVVGTTAPTGADAEEWLVWTEPDGGLALQSLLSGGAPVPRLATAEPTGTVDVRDDGPAGTADASAQRWQLTDRRQDPSAAAVDGSVTADCLLIRTQDGTRCLLDHGADAPVLAGDCSSPAARWRPQGLSAPTGT
ncbi:RICIN domain-containing protein [Kitasatospora sp. NPDC001159]